MSFKVNELTSTKMAIELSTKRKGHLEEYVSVTIKGNYRKGPVPVTVLYPYLFHYSDEWQDESGNTIFSTSKSFDTPEERSMFVSNHFSIITPRGA